MWSAPTRSLLRAEHHIIALRGHKLLHQLRSSSIASVRLAGAHDSSSQVLSCHVSAAHVIILSYRIAPDSRLHIRKLLNATVEGSQSRAAGRCSSSWPMSSRATECDMCHTSGRATEAIHGCSHPCTWMSQNQSQQPANSIKSWDSKFHKDGVQSERTLRLRQSVATADPPALELSPTESIAARATAL